MPQHAETVRLQANLMLNSLHAVVNAYFILKSEEHTFGSPRSGFDLGLAARSKSCLRSSPRVRSLYGAIAPCLASDGAKKALKVLLTLVCMLSMLAMAFVPNQIFNMFTDAFGFNSVSYVTPGTHFYHCIQQYGVSKFCATANLDAPWSAPPPPALP